MTCKAGKRDLFFKRKCVLNVVFPFCLDENISYLFDVIRRVQNFTLALEMRSTWGESNGCLHFRHRYLILNIPDCNNTWNLYFIHRLFAFFIPGKQIETIFSDEKISLHIWQYQRCCEFSNNNDFKIFDISEHLIAFHEFFDFKKKIPYLTLQRFFLVLFQTKRLYLLFSNGKYFA